MAYRVKLILANPIQLADQLIKAADEASSFKSHCSDLKEKTQTLSALLHQATQIGKDLYERPTLLVIDNTNQVLERALTLVQRCRANCLFKRAFFNIIPAAAFQKTSSQLQNSANNLSWLLRISAAIYDGSQGDYLSQYPPLAANEPVLCFIWEQIAILSAGPLSHRLAAAKSLVSFTNDNLCHGKLIQDGDCSVFAKVLKEGPMQLQAEVAWAISELVANYAPFQEHFAQHNVVLLLVHHLAFETIEEHSRYAITNKSNHSVVVASNGSKGKSPVLGLSVVKGDDPESSSRPSGREYEEPTTKAYMKAMAAKALSRLAKGNSAICKIITETIGLLCFAVLLEKGPKEVQCHSAMALMEITAVAEEDPLLRRSVFNPNLPTCKAVVDQLVRTIGNEDSELVLPCLKAIGNLARIFCSSETRVIRALVQLLGGKAEFYRDACIVLVKFACPENYLHVEHSKAILAAGGANPLIRLVYFEEQIVQSPAMVLLCYIAMDVPDSRELAEATVLNVLEWASTQTHVFRGEAVKLLLKAKSRLVLYQLIQRSKRIPIVPKLVVFVVCLFVVYSCRLYSFLCAIV